MVAKDTTTPQTFRYVLFIFYKIMLRSVWRLCGEMFDDQYTDHSAGERNLKSDLHLMCIW